MLNDCRGCTYEKKQNGENFPLVFGEKLIHGASGTAYFKVSREVEEVESIIFLWITY
jgi:hypothetical protein